MAKENILTYLDTQLTKKLPEYDTALDWDAKNHTIEIVMRLFAENSEQIALDDAEGVLSEEEIIEFEDGVLLFNPQKSLVQEDDYLAVIPFVGKKGLQKAVLDALVDYLKEVLDQGQSNLLDFLADDSEEAVFELRFDNNRLEELVTSYQQKEESWIAYPSY